MSNQHIAIFATGLITDLSKFKNRPFQFIRGDGNVIVLPLDMIDELAALPDTVATWGGGINHDLLGAYNGIELGTQTRLHRLVVQRKLAPQAVGRLVSDIEDEATAVFEEMFPSHHDKWVEIEPWTEFRQVSARLASRMLVGRPLCRNPKWIETAIYYTENSKLQLRHNSST